MSFDLFENPFAVLGLSNGASPSAITARAREFGGERASQASRTLISPRTRLQAELAFLPGLTQGEAQKCLAAIREGKLPEAPDFPPLARANLLAHLASNGGPAEIYLTALADIGAHVRADTLEILNRDRRCAGMPPVSQPIFNAAIERLETQHAEALNDGALALENGTGMLSQIVYSLGPSITTKSVFLRQATSAWERSTAAETGREIERAQELEAKLDGGPDDRTVAGLTDLIRSIAARTRPCRELARHFGLPHDLSADVVNRWRSLTSNLVNNQHALTQACTILEVLADEFGTSDDAGQRVARDLANYRERIEDGEHLPEMQRFAAAISAANEKPAQFKGDCLKRIRDGRRSLQDDPIVVEFWGAFVAAARNAPSDLPWRALRSFAIRLHNEFSEAEAALLLTDLALEHAYGNQFANEIRPSLEADRCILLKHVLGKQLNLAIEKKRRGEIRELLSRLIPVTEDLTERRNYQFALRKLQWQAGWLFLRRAFYVGVLGFIVYAAVTGNNPVGGGSDYHSQSPATSTETPSMASAMPPADDGLEIKPAPSARTLSRSELRWCIFQKVRLDGEEAYLNSIRYKPNLQVAVFNSATGAFNGRIADLNASCKDRQYYRTDKDAVDAELTTRSTGLRSQGESTGSSSYVAANGSGTPPATTPSPEATLAYSNPVPGGYRPAQPSASPEAPPQPSFSRAYLDGQQDRRSWEEWFSALGDDFRGGAEWWASVRSTPHPPPCSRTPGTDRQAAIEGCNEAKAKLTPSDRRRHAEPEYRAGWNNP